MTIIASPSRDQLEERFPTQARVTFDSVAAGELRAIAEARRTLERALAPLRHVNDSGEPLAGAPDVVHAHYIAAITEYVERSNDLIEAGGKGLAAVSSEEWYRHMQELMARTTVEEADYMMRSMAATAMSHSILVPAGTVNRVDAVVDAILRPFTQAAMIVVNAHYLRRYPDIRFRVTSYVTVVFHWDELGRDGTPRVSLDGYLLQGGAKL